MTARTPDQVARNLSERLSKTQQHVAGVVARLFPVGSIVRVEGERPFAMRVARHGAYWSDPLTVYGENTLTGKPRRFYAGSDRISAVHKPPAKGAGPVA